MKPITLSSAPSFQVEVPAAVETDANGRALLSLNGDWDLAFDPENVGMTTGWAKAFPDDALTAPVPSVWERVRPGYDGVGWYRRRFTLPAGWERRMLRLRFHAAQYFAEVWLNGARLGTHEGGFLPFEFPVSKKVRTGENELVVRVINPPMDREIEGFRCGAPLNQGPIPIGKAGWYYNFGGLWQDVELQATSGAAITQVALEPWPSRDEVILRMTVDLEGAAGDYEIECMLRGWSGEAVVPEARRRRWRLRAGTNQLRWRIAFPDARRWSPEDPFLHVAELSLRQGGRRCDRHEVRFGMREFSVRDGRFTLNGEPVVLKGFLHQNSYPRTLVAPEDRAFAERELRLVKDHGFNFVRAHLQPAVPAWLDLCDELGLLVMAEPPIGWIEANPLMEARCWREISGLVERDRNHASVVVWCLMNEVFHLKGFVPRELCELTARWLVKVGRLDPTRAAIDVSGGHGLVALGGAADMLPDTATNGRTACLSLPGERALQPIQDAHIYHEFPPKEISWRRMRTTGEGRGLFVVTEYGAPPVPPSFTQVMAGYTPAERELGLEDYALHREFAESLREHWKDAAWPRMFVTEDAWIEANGRLRAEEMRLVTTAVRSNPRTAGYCFCQLADASGELFGAVDVWRQPKPLMKALADGSAPGTLGVFAWPRVATGGAEVTVELVWLDERAGDARGEWTLELRNAAGRPVRTWQKAFRMRKAGPQVLMSTCVNLPKEPGVYAFHAGGHASTTGALTGGIEVRVVSKPQLPRGPVAVAPKEFGAQAWLGRHRCSVVPYGNNFREVQWPVLFDLSKPLARFAQMELMGQLRKVLQVGGAAVVFEPEMALIGEDLVGRPIRMQPLRRPIAFARRHAIFDGLPQDVITDFTYAEVQPDKFDRTDDIRALGGEVLYGALSMHMWTRPAVFYQGAALYTLPVGRGTLIVCHLRICERIDTDPVAALLMANLIRFAQSCIQPGDTLPLLSRCIDPLSFGA